MSDLFPMFMKLEGKRCLVVGAGKVGEPKIGSLLDTGARLHVVALEATEAVHRWGKAGQIELEIRAYTENDLAGTFMAIVATSSRELNASIQKLRQQLERQFGPAYAQWVAELGETRKLVLASSLDPQRKRGLLLSLASREALNAALLNQQAALEEQEEEQEIDKRETKEISDQNDRRVTA